MLRMLHDMTYYSTHSAAQALADTIAATEAHMWSYTVQQSPAGFYVAVFDDDNFFMGIL
jgi:hypothetical protein